MICPLLLPWGSWGAPGKAPSRDRHLKIRSGMGGSPGHRDFKRVPTVPRPSSPPPACLGSFPVHPPSLSTPHWALPGRFLKPGDYQALYLPSNSLGERSPSHGALPLKMESQTRCRSSITWGSEVQPPPSNPASESELGSGGWASALV